MLTPALMQPLATTPTLVPPSPVRPSGEPVPTAQKGAFRTTDRSLPEQPKADDGETASAWRAPVRGDTAFTAQRLAQEEAEEAGAAADELTDEQLALLADLKARDAEVRAHEQAHKAVGGRYAGAPSYETTRGPDGQRYAIGGEVSIDVSPEGTPDDTIAKMLQVKAAALAPAEPSPQDRRVAAMADAQRLTAMADKREQDRAMQEALASDSGATVLPFEYRKPPAPMFLRGMAAYGQSLAITGTSPYAQRAESFDLVA